MGPSGCFPTCKTVAFSDEGDHVHIVTSYTNDEVPKFEPLGTTEGLQCFAPPPVPTVSMTAGAAVVVPAPPLIRNAGAALAEDAHPSLADAQPAAYATAPSAPPAYRPGRMAVVLPQRGRTRERRGGCNARVRGSRRSTVSAARRGGDSGDDPALGDPEPPRRGGRVGRSSYAEGVA